MKDLTPVLAPAVQPWVVFHQYTDCKVPLSQHYPELARSWSLLLAVQMRIGWTSVPLCVAPHYLDAATRPCCACAALQAEPKEIPEAVQAFFAIPLEPVVHPSFRLHEICYRLINALLAHTDHVHGKNPSPYSGILFFPVCLFEIVFICPSHSTSGIDGSSKLSVRGVKIWSEFLRAAINQKRITAKTNPIAIPNMYTTAAIPRLRILMRILTAPIIVDIVITMLRIGGMAHNV